MHYLAKQCLNCRRKRIIAVCQECQTEFHQKPSRPRSACGPACAVKLRARGSRNSQSRKVPLVCEHCGKAKLVSPTYANRRFCSTDCANHGKCGEGSASWKGGVTSEHAAFYSSREWKVVCERIWARDRATCRRCGTKHRYPEPPYHVHHIRLWAKFPEFRTDHDNLVLLCRGCHRFVHSRDNVSGELIFRHR
ncbi:HNH endonuclease [Rhizobium sp. Root651]|uniref:HNH endonuclease n=1 Tax=Rhizobium sp. Root651 TaxID=1736577 RepID=UPI00336A40D0